MRAAGTTKHKPVMLKAVDCGADRDAALARDHHWVGACPATVVVRLPPAGLEVSPDLETIMCEINKSPSPTRCDI